MFQYYFDVCRSKAFYDGAIRSSEDVVVGDMFFFSFIDGVPRPQCIIAYKDVIFAEEKGIYNLIW